MAEPGVYSAVFPSVQMLQEYIMLPLPFHHSLDTVVALLSAVFASKGLSQAQQYQQLYHAGLTMLSRNPGSPAFAGLILTVIPSWIARLNHRQCTEANDFVHLPAAQTAALLGVLGELVRYPNFFPAGSVVTHEQITRSLLIHNVLPSSPGDPSIALPGWTEDISVQDAQDLLTKHPSHQVKERENNKLLAK